MPTAQDAPDERILTPAFLLLASAFLLYVINLTLFALTPYYLELRGASPVLYGAAGGTVGLASFGFMVLWGHRADARTRKASVLRFMVVMGAGNVFALVALALPAPAIFVTLVTQGFMEALGWPLLVLWAAELSPESRRADALAWFGIAGLLGDALGPFFGEVALSLAPDPTAPVAYANVFGLACGLFVVAAGLLALAPDAPRRAAPQGTQRLWPLLRQTAPRYKLATVLVFGGMLGVMLNLGKNYVASLGLDFFSVLLVGYCGGAVASRVVFPQLRVWLGVARLASAGFALMGVALVLLSQVSGYAMLAVAGTVYGVSHGVLFPGSMARFLDFYAEAERGRASTLFMGCFSLGLGLLPLLSGLVLEGAGFRALFVLLAMVAWVCVPLNMLAERSHARALVAEAA